MDLTGHVALVTGASGNIGQATATALAEAGADVGITSRSDAEGCAETAQLVEDAGGNAAVALGDLSQTDDIDRIVESVRTELGAITVLVTNASIRPKEPFLELEHTEWDRVLDTNLRSTFYLIQQALPDMIDNGGGSVITILGSSAFLGGAEKSHVYASKMGSVGLLRSLTKEFGGDGVRINAISPGAIDTERDTTNYPDTWKSDLIRAIPLDRLGTPEEVARACCFLASEYASFITGQVLHVNGGLYPTPNLYSDP